VTELAVGIAESTLKTVDELAKVTKYLTAVANLANFIPYLSAVSGVLSLVSFFAGINTPSETE